jgi:AmmeMemoRadiSam system protein B
MDRVRQPAVSGSFYPDSAEEVEASLDALIEAIEPKRKARALVVPHAGWIYSGRVAGAVYGRVSLPPRCILLGPNHTGLGAPGAVMVRGLWRYPGGELPIAEDLALALLGGAAGDLLTEDELAHRREHALEVQLPFLRRVEPTMTFVPVSLMRTSLDFCRTVGHAVAEVVSNASEPICLISSTDLNHYAPQAVSNQKDRLAIDAILSLDPERLHRTVTEHQITMCGIAPTTALLFALQELGAQSAELVRYMTSGDVSGDYRRVVGYCGIIIT